MVDQHAGEEVDVRSRGRGRGRRSRLGVYGKLILVVMPFTAVALGSVGALAFLRARSSLEDAAAGQVELTVREKEAAIDRWVTDLIDGIAVLADEPHTLPAIGTIVSKTAEATARADAGRLLMRRWIDARRPYRELLVLDPVAGEILFSTEPSSVGRAREDQPFFRDGRRDPVVQGPYFSLQTQQPEMTAAAPVRDPTGATIAVLAGHVDLDHLNRITAPALSVRASDDSFITNRAGLFVTQPRFIEDPALLQLGTRTADVRACAGGPASHLRYRDYRGVAVVGAVRYIPTLDACVVAKTDLSEAFAPVEELRHVLQRLALAVVAASAIAVLVMSRAIVRPVLALQAGVVRFARGDVSARVEVTSSDEIGQLAAAFNNMAGTIAATTEELQDRRRELEAANDELREINSQLEAFTYTVSHDLRSPLRAISSFSQLLVEEHGAELTADAWHCVDRIRHNVDRMGCLIEDLIEFSRVASGGMTLELVDMEQLVRSTFDELAPARAGRDLELTVGSLPPAMVDGELARVVMVNLLENAVKFTRDRPHGVVEVAASNDPEGTVYTVRDNGVGFNAEYAGKLFEVFERLHPLEEYEGTGIGLATVRRIITRHGGRVWGESVEGQGAAFHFSLGAARAGERTLVPRDQEPKP